ncbi:MAG: glycosyl hydrolase family 17 [Lewinellaceae bacterium]|nr:glycosyl hydrolase family 17 [Lewinellaceae bacterium]
MNPKVLLLSWCLLITFTFSCSSPQQTATSKTAAEILGNPDYLAFSFGGYRHSSRDTVPTVSQLKEDLAILAAMDIKLIRTYNTQQFQETANLLQAIRELKTENPAFEMYVMLGAWIDCAGAWSGEVNHEEESLENNTAEVDAAVAFAKEYPDIVKIIAVGNEAMVHWAASYFVRPKIILKWVNYLQERKQSGELPGDLWITSSDNFASWGGGDASYHTADLVALIKAVDYVSMHTYPFHDTHYNPAFWKVPAAEGSLPDSAKVAAAMLRARDYAIAQYQAVADFLDSLGVKKPIHIGETGWASMDSNLYGPTGSHATDEYKAKLYYDYMREWTNAAGMSCFYFEAFDERWKDPTSTAGSENHFGLINLQGEAKYALWDLVDAGVFKGLTRGGKPITKSYQGDKAALMTEVLPPPLASEKD